ncbi:tRNA dihydrouridine synthase DusB [Serpentinicella sp. ANB-PHB4]|uniref:tRNA dihydrouridine synthase DusB n=1 Tax=Serpentinicella sp. ANB-PHB4 TaxID=3074076 RepID=UPI00286499E4|nr:tRNA dihydrouridine synthase DusB [Serpentinicella sp. ANB-PHB4]MDR5659107.1 tRNA dihydrouridine synthase DusB [Serpentinicella sp. ANB-PHB4]
MKFGNIEVEGDVFLAPMAGVTDLPFRLMCKKYGCGLVYTEMVSAKGLYYGDKKTEHLLHIIDEEKPVAIQIFGSDPEIMARAAYLLNGRENIILDINMGCPTPKIVKNGDGSALMKNPKKAGEVIRAVVKESVKPVTVKIRKGWDDASVNAVEMAKIIEDSGAQAVAVHGRTREQFYAGNADWDIIKKVKASVNIPVIGNGDVFSAQDGMQILQQTKCDGIMIGRGAQGNPWIFNQINEYIKSGKIIDRPSLEEVVSGAIAHMDLCVQFKGEYLAVREMRKHIAWYLKGFKHAAQVRHRINSLESIQEIKALLLDYNTKQI